MVAGRNGGLNPHESHSSYPRQAEPNSSLESQWLGANEIVRTVDVEQPPLVSSVVFQPHERVFLAGNGLYVSLGVVNHLRNNRLGAYGENHLGVERRRNLTAKILVAAGLGSPSEPELIRKGSLRARQRVPSTPQLFPFAACLVLRRSSEIAKRLGRLGKRAS